MDEIGDWVCRVNAGEDGARDKLFAAAYPELRKLARSRLYDGGRNTCLDTTALVHESYLRIARGGELRAQDRRAFFAYAARVMRSIIIDDVRERQAQRHGGGLVAVTLNTALIEGLEADGPGLLQVDEALEQLAQAEPRLAQVVEMRYFGGCTEAEVAEALGVTDRTVRRDWEKARMLLAVLLQP